MAPPAGSTDHTVVWDTVRDITPALAHTRVALLPMDHMGRAARPRHITRELVRTAPLVRGQMSTGVGDRLPFNAAMIGPAANASPTVVETPLGLRAAIKVE